MSKGSRSERELVNQIDETEGWVAMRAPSSGSATERDLPDVIAGGRGRTIVIEAKSSGGDPIYVAHEEIDALRRFADAFGAEMYVSTRWFSHSIRDATTYLTHPSEMHETDNFRRAKYDTVESEWKTLQQVLQGDHLE